MNKIRIIGDVHGNFARYKKLIQDCDNSIQIGDMGIGFYRQFGDYLIETANPPHKFMTREGTNHRFIRGNHDNPNSCKKHSQWIKDGTIENGIMFIGGANSIDKGMRTLGIDWWNDEELSIEELNGLISLYEMERPRIMITHECPDSIANELFGDVILEGKRRLRWNDNSRTRQAFDTMFSIHQPKIWIHGHWHQSRDVKINGTRFKCLAELETFDLEV